MTTTKKPAKTAAASETKYEGFTEEERAAMKERGQELKSSARRGSRKAEVDTESDVLGKIAEMTDWIG